MHGLEERQTCGTFSWDMGNYVFWICGMAPWAFMPLSLLILSIGLDVSQEQPTALIFFFSPRKTRSPWVRTLCNESNDSDTDGCSIFSMSVWPLTTPQSSTPNPTQPLSPSFLGFPTWWTHPPRWRGPGCRWKDLGVLESWAEDEDLGIELDETRGAILLTWWVIMTPGIQ